MRKFVALLFAIALPAVAQLTTAVLSPAPAFQYTVNNQALAGAKLCTYAAGTTTPLATWTTSAGSVANANPIILDVYGRVTVWIKPLYYKFVLKNGGDGTCATGSTVFTQDNIGDSGLILAAALAGSSGATLINYTATGGGATTRTVSAKLGDVITVKDFGAAGNGVADDTAAIQSAINYAQSLPGGGGIVTLPPGAYNVTTLSISSAITLQGAGYGGYTTAGLNAWTSPTLIKCTSPTADCIALNLPSTHVLSGVVLRGFQVQGNRYIGGASSGSCIHFNGSSGGTAIRNWSVQDVWVRDCQSYGIQVSGNVFEGEMRNVMAMNSVLDGIIMEAVGGFPPAVIRLYFVNSELNDRYGLNLSGGGASISDFGGYYAANGQHGVLHYGITSYKGTYFEGNGRSSTNTYDNLHVMGGYGSIDGCTFSGSSISKNGVHLLGGGNFRVGPTYWDAHVGKDILIDAGYSVAIVDPQYSSFTITDNSNYAERLDLLHMHNGSLTLDNGTSLGWSDASFARAGASQIATNTGVAFVPTGTFAVQIGGTEQGRIDASGFRLGGSTASYLTFDKSTTVALTFGVITANTCVISGAFSFTSVVDGDALMLGVPVAAQETACGGVASCLQYSAYVSAAGLAKIKACNVSGTNSSAVAAATFKVIMLR